MNQTLLSSNNFRKRNNFAYDSIFFSLNLSKLFYDIKFEGAENIPKQGPAIILPKHQCYSDSLLISWMVKKSTGNRLRFFMKYSLPDWIESLGAIKFVTSGDYRHLRKVLGEQGAVDYCREFNQKSYDKLESCLRDKEMILLFPEGKLSPKKMNPIKLEGLAHFQKIQEKIQKEIPLIPMGIEYGPLYKGRFCLPPNKVRVRAGQRRYFNKTNLEQLTYDISEDLRKLSGISA